MKVFHVIFDLISVTAIFVVFGKLGIFLSEDGFFIVEVVVQLLFHSSVFLNSLTGPVALVQVGIGGLPFTGRLGVARELRGEESIVCYKFVSLVFIVETHFLAFFFPPPWAGLPFFLLLGLPWPCLVISKLRRPPLSLDFWVHSPLARTVHSWACLPSLMITWVLWSMAPPAAAPNYASLMAFVVALSP